MTWQEFNKKLKQNYPLSNREWRKACWKASNCDEVELDEDDDYIEECDCPLCQPQERTMYAQAINLTPVVQQSPAYDPLEYITGRIREEYSAKERELRIKYHMRDADPQTIKELKELLKEGKYYFDIPKSYDEEEKCYALGYFHLGERPDKKGFKEAMVKLEAAYEAVNDLVKIKTDEDTRLKALQDFQAATFH